MIVSTDFEHYKQFDQEVQCEMIKFVPHTHIFSSDYNAMFDRVSNTGCFFSKLQTSYIEFSIPCQCNVYCYYGNYSDGGGKANHAMKIYKNNNGTYVEYGVTSTLETNSWVLFIGELGAGTYKLVPYEGEYAYTLLNELYFEQVDNGIYLIKQGGNYYSVDDTGLINVTLLKDKVNLEQNDYLTYGFRNLGKLNTVINSFTGKIKILRYAEK